MHSLWRLLPYVLFFSFVFVMVSFNYQLVIIFNRQESLNEALSRSSWIVAMPLGDILLIY